MLIIEYLLTVVWYGTLVTMHRWQELASIWTRVPMLWFQCVFARRKKESPFSVWVVVLLMLLVVCWRSLWPFFVSALGSMQPFKPIWVVYHIEALLFYGFLCSDRQIVMINEWKWRHSCRMGCALRIFAVCWKVERKRTMNYVLMIASCKGRYQKSP